jgi:hypothetical protein
MKKQDLKQDEIVSLNDSVLSDFSVDELENRLETNPLAVGQLFDITTENSADMQSEGCCFFTDCRERE